MIQQTLYIEILIYLLLKNKENLHFIIRVY